VDCRVIGLADNCGGKGGGSKGHGVGVDWMLELKGFVFVLGMGCLLVVC
jgi:hypothetical protein